MAKIIWKNINTVADLNTLGLGRVQFSIEWRGGYMGFDQKIVAEWAGVSETQLPRTFGVHCYDLGDWKRGPITCSSYSLSIPIAKTKKLRLLSEACKRAYKAIEDEMGMNDPVYEDGETSAETKTKIG